MTAGQGKHSHTICWLLMMWLWTNLNKKNQTQRQILIGGIWVQVLSTLWNSFAPKSGVQKTYHWENWYGIRPAGIAYETKAKGMAFLFLSMLIYKLIKAIIFPLHCKMNDISQDGCSSSESFLMLVVGDVTVQILGKEWRS